MYVAMGYGGRETCLVYNKMCETKDLIFYLGDYLIKNLSRGH